MKKIVYILLITYCFRPQNIVSTCNDWNCWNWHSKSASSEHQLIYYYLL